MALQINTNTNSLTAQRNASTTQLGLATAIQRLSSGLRVNSAKDDAAGLAIASRMETQVRGITVAIRNANDGISLAQVAEGGLQTMTDMLQRMRELAVQAINSTNTTGGGGDLDKLSQEYQQLAAELGRVYSSVSFNGQGLLNGSADYTFQVGPNATDNNRITVDSASLSLSGATAVTTLFTPASTATALAISSNLQNSAQLGVLDLAISRVNDTRSRLGAVQARFENTIASLRIALENQAAARGRIMDADFAMETAALSRGQILQQAGVAMISQANQLPQGVLRLLQ